MVEALKHSRMISILVHGEISTTDDAFVACGTCLTADHSRPCISRCYSSMRLYTSTYSESAKQVDTRVWWPVYSSSPRAESDSPNSLMANVSWDFPGQKAPNGWILPLDQPQWDGAQPLERQDQPLHVMGQNDKTGTVMFSRGSDGGEREERELRLYRDERAENGGWKV